MPVILTEEEFKSALPPQMKKSVNPLLIMDINNTLSNEEEWEHYKNNLIDFSTVLQQGKWKLSSYLNAVRYIGYKMIGDSNREAYRKTFPDRFNKFIRTNTSEKDISSYTSMYNSTKLVMAIYKMALIPTYLLNAPIFQQAINTQAMIMNNEDASFKVRTDAANSLLTHLKAPEVTKIELDVGVHHDSVIADYEKALAMMVDGQMKMIAAGGDVKQIANAKIPVAEVIDV